MDIEASVIAASRARRQPYHMLTSKVLSKLKIIRSSYYGRSCQQSVSRQGGIQYADISV